MKSIMASWKTTLVGLAGVILAVVQASQATSIGGMLQDPKFQVALLIGVLGFVAKDGNVTGGTSGQPSSPEALQVANQAPSASNPPEPTK